MSAELRDRIYTISRDMTQSLSIARCHWVSFCIRGGQGDLTNREPGLQSALGPLTPISHTKSVVDRDSPAVQYPVSIRLRKLPPSTDDLLPPFPSPAASFVNVVASSIVSCEVR